jgi:hypothetical protein
MSRGRRSPLVYTTTTSGQRAKSRPGFTSRNDVRGGRRSASARRFAGRRQTLLGLEINKALGKKQQPATPA